MVLFYVCVYVCMFYCIVLVVENLLVYFNESLWWLILNENFKIKYRKIRVICEMFVLIVSEIFVI